ncbi:MAG: 30S ribosomal protein S6, partial [Patescibacteria group bacterium]
RKLAYPVDHYFYGYYIFSEFDCDPSTVNLINRDLELSNEILRHHIEIKVPGLAPLIPFGGAKETLSLSPRDREHRGSGDRNEAIKPNRTVVDAAVAEVTAGVEPKVEETVDVAATPETASVNTDELNKKLDEILNNEIV